MPEAVFITRRMIISEYFVFLMPVYFQKFKVYVWPSISSPCSLCTLRAHPPSNATTSEPLSCKADHLKGNEVCLNLSLAHARTHARKACHRRAWMSDNAAPESAESREHWCSRHHDTLRQKETAQPLSPVSCVTSFLSDTNTRSDSLTSTEICAHKRTNARTRTCTDANNMFVHVSLWHNVCLHVSIRHNVCMQVSIRHNVCVHVSPWQAETQNPLP